MYNTYSIWKYLFIFGICVVGFLYSVPNVYMDEPAIQLSVDNNKEISNKILAQIKDNLANQNIQIKDTINGQNTYISFYDNDSQLQAIDIINNMDIKVKAALTLVPTVPAWLQYINAYPMKLGLDLRGGVHLLIEVDIDSVIKKRQDALSKNFKKELRNNRIRYKTVTFNAKDNTLTAFFNSSAESKQALSILASSIRDVEILEEQRGDDYVLIASYTANALNEIRQHTIEQTMATLRNRVNELGVSEAIVMQQGANRIAVDLPGIQDANRAKSIVGGTATLEFHLQNRSHDAYDAQNTGVVPAGTKLMVFKNMPVLIDTDIILSGDAIAFAVSSFDEMGQPSVNISLGSGDDSRFNKITRDNINNNMPILFIETKTVTKKINGKLIKTKQRSEKIISLATIRSALGSNFSITGITNPNEARDLALLLRAGSLPAAVEIVEETTVGPTLGMENIKKGLESLAIGLILVMLFMVVYYRVLGLFANIALVLNLFLLVALLSWIGATLTLPGIAAIVLTLGMAIDANVLIYERIREELRAGSQVALAINAGYDRAFATILDANLTTLIVAMVLLAIGTGPIQAFAITLIIGLMTSMFTGVICTRAMVNLLYGGNNVSSISIGIRR